MPGKRKALSVRFDKPLVTIGENWKDKPGFIALTTMVIIALLLQW